MTNKGILVFQTGETIELEQGFTYKRKQFVVENDLEKDFWRKICRSYLLY